MRRMSQQQNKTIVVVGDRSAGKSAIVHRLIDETFDFGTYKPTIDDCFNIVWKLPDGQYLQIQMIDTAAWNEFPAMQSLYIKMAHLVLAVFDVTNPDWRKTLLTVINGVRKIKDDADIFVVGNKCDLLTRKDSCTPNQLSEVIGHSCVGHVFTSALSQQGIVGLKQLILCSKSQLTEGHYTEFSFLPKRKKLKKRLNGLALALNFNKKEKESPEKEPAKPKYREPVVYPQQPHYIQYRDLTRGNFDKLFDAANKEQQEEVKLRYKKHRTQVSRSDAIDLPSVKDRRRSAIEHTSDYSSPGTSPNGSYGDPSAYNHRHRKSLDFSMMAETDSYNPKRLFTRQISKSHGDQLDKQLLDITSSNSTVMSDTSSNSYEDSSSGTSPRTLRINRVLTHQPDSTGSSRHSRLSRSSGLGVSSSLDDDDDSIRIPGTMDQTRGHRRNKSSTSQELTNRLSNISLDTDPSGHVELRRGRKLGVAERRSHKSDSLIPDINRNSLIGGYCS